MITKDNLCDLLEAMEYREGTTGVYEKRYSDFECCKMEKFWLK